MAMNVTRRVRNRIATAFIAGKAQSGGGLISDTAQFFAAGVFLCRTRRLVVPAEVLACLALFLASSVVVHNAVYFDSLDWMNKIIDYGWSSVSLSCAYTMLAYRKRIKALGERVDAWWTYPYLEKEEARLKKESETWINHFKMFYVPIGGISIFFYTILPAAKFFYKAPKERIEALVIQVWTPVPIDTTWGFSIVYSFGALSILFSFLMHSQLFLFLMSLSVVIGRQARMIGIAFTTIEQRVGKMMEGEIYTAEAYRWNQLIHREIKSGVNHFQQLYRCALDMTEIFASITNVTYIGGMWVMCSIGVVAAQEMSFVKVMQACMMASMVITSQYIFSFVSELLIEEIQNLRDSVYNSAWYEFPVKSRKTFHIFQSMLYADRFPTLQTCMGTKTNMENLSQVIYGSYCYFSMIITMKTS